MEIIKIPSFVIARPQAAAIHDPELHGLPRSARNDDKSESVIS